MHAGGGERGLRSYGSCWGPSWAAAQQSAAALLALSRQQCLTPWLLETPSHRRGRGAPQLWWPGPGARRRGRGARPPWWSAKRARPRRSCSRAAAGRRRRGRRRLQQRPRSWEPWGPWLRSRGGGGGMVRRSDPHRAGGRAPGASTARRRQSSRPGPPRGAQPRWLEAVDISHTPPLGNINNTNNKRPHVAWRLHDSRRALPPAV